MQVDPPTTAPRWSDPSGNRRTGAERSPNDPEASWEVVSRRAGESGRSGRQHAATQPLLPASAASALAARTAIGDAAVRFDARALVSPVAGPAPGAAADQAAAPHTAAAPTASREAKADAGLPEMIATLAQQVAATPSGGAHPRFAAHAQLPARSAAAESRAALPYSRATTSPSPTASRPSAASVAPPARPAAAASAQHLSARIVAFADEVRIVVRGATLSADERTALIQIAADALAGTPLADRPVRIFANGETS